MTLTLPTEDVLSSVLRSSRTVSEDKVREIEQEVHGDHLTPDERWTGLCGHGHEGGALR